MSTLAFLHLFNHHCQIFVFYFVSSETDINPESQTKWVLIF